MIALPTTSYSEPEVSELARDVDEQLRSLVTVTKRSLTAQYTEPLYLALDAEPYAIIAARIRNRDTPSTVVANGLRCSFEYEGDRRRARIDDIEGMSTGATFYVFDFLVVE